MKIEFEVPEGVRLCSFAFDNLVSPLRFRAVVAGEDLMGTDGILRPHAIETGRGENPQAAIDNAIERLRSREATLREWVAPPRQRVYNKPIGLTLDLSDL